MLNEAKRLYRLGGAIHWLQPKSKRPVESGWTTGPRKPWDYLTKTYHDNYNVGVRLGSPSKIGDGYLAVVDVDVKSTDERHKKEAIAAAQKLIGKAQCPVVKSGRGNGSRHYYCLTPTPFKTFNPAQSSEEVKVFMPSKVKVSKRELEILTKSEIDKGLRLAPAWEISLYSDGRQVVLPPSIHPDSGKRYEWATPLENMASLPTLSFELPAENVTNAARIGGENVVKTKTQGVTDFTVEPVELAWLPLSETMRESIVHGTGVFDRSAFLLPAAAALVSAGLTQNEVLTVLTDPKTFLGAASWEHSNTKSRAAAANWVWRYTLEKIMNERDPKRMFPSESEIDRVLSPKEIAAQNKEFEGERPWQQDLRRSKTKDGEPGKVLGTLFNISAILENTIEQPLFQKDEFANRESYGVDAPWGSKLGTELSDMDSVLIKNWFAIGPYEIEPRKEIVNEAMMLIAHENRYHPVKDWLTSLKWDGVKRASTWLKDYVQADAPEPYLSDISRKFLVAMVARIFQPGCQWDYTLILEGEQGTRKSTTARVLAGDRWFCDHLPELKDKDAMLNLQGSWLVELGELKSIKHSDAATVKSFLTRRIDRVRAPYGRRWIDSPRQSVFIGTVNENEYFKDPTGNRRFWPIRIHRCDVEALSLVREQLFAEAMYLYKEGEKLYLEGLAHDQALEAQEERRVDDEISEMESAFADFLEQEKRKPKTERFDFSRFRMKELFEGANIPWGKWADARYSIQHGAQVLRNFGFTRTKVNGQRIWRKTMAVLGQRGRDNPEDFF